jgi:uncharacterized protein
MLNWTLWPLLISSFFISSVEAHFLWRVDGERPSYLYGTIHSSDTRVREIPPAVMESLSASATFHPELEFSPENLGRMTAAIFAAGETDLEKTLSPALWTRVARQAEKEGVPAFLIRRVPVELLPVVFAAPPETDFNHVVDVQVYERARADGLAIHQLETVEEQMSVFRNLPRETALAFLEDALNEAEKGYPAISRTLELYGRGDLEGLEAFLRKEFDRYDAPELEAALITRRNRLMAERLLPFLKEGGAFAAVGVGHLPGEEGIVALLEQKGFAVSRVPLRPPSPRELEKSRSPVGTDR